MATFGPNDLAPGTHVQVNRGGQWLPATIVQPLGPDRFVVSYDGYGPQWNEPVGIDRIKGPGGAGFAGAVARDYRPGEKVLVTSQNRLLLADVLQQVGADVWRVHYDGYGPEVAENVSAERLRRPFVGTSAHGVGESVSVDVNGQVVPARVVALSAPDRWVVRFDAYGPQYDQEVAADRLRVVAPPPVASVSASPSPAPVPAEPDIKADKGGKKGGKTDAPSAAPAPPPPLQVGDAVAVLQRGAFFPATITAAGSAGQWRVRFDGQGGEEDVSADRVQRLESPAKGVKYQPNQPVLVEWHGIYVAGKILKEQDKGQYKVRFDGQGPEADEIVPVKRLRLK